jgi:hypothetical protein
MMRLINEYYTNHYQELLNIAKGIAYKRGRNIDPEIYVTNSYIYLTEICDKIPSEPFIERYAKQYIKNEINWNNSKTNINHTIRDNQEITDTLTDESDNDEYKMLPFYYYKKAHPDKIKHIIFDVYVTKEIRTCRDMAKHFGISQVSANNLIKQLKQELCELKKNLEES